MATLIVDSWSGGLSDGSRKGVEGSFIFGQGMNYKDDLDVFTANLALAKNSGATVDQLVKWIEHDGAQGDTYFYGATGDLYKRTSAGVWSVARAVANSKGQGLAVYADYLYYRQNTQIGRYGLLSGVPGFTDNWKAAGDNVQTVDAFGTIKTFMNLVCFANARYLATWDGATFDYDHLTFPPGWYVRDIGVMGDYLAIAVNNAEDIANATRGVLFFWDGTSSTYNFFSEVTEPISSIQANQDSVYIFAGGAGNIYLYNGKVTKIKNIPFMGQGKLAYVYPGADTNYRGQLHFGLAGGDSATVYREVYSYGKPNKNYPDTLNIEYPISTGTVKTTDVNIGAVKAVGNALYVGWSDDTDEGVDKLGTALQTTVTYESRIFSLDREGAFKKFRLFCKPLASGETITLNYKADQISAWTAIGTASYTSDGVVSYKKFDRFNNEIRATDIQFQIILTGSATMPTVTKLTADYDDPTMGVVSGNNVYNFDLNATSTGKTTANYESELLSLPKQTAFTRFKLFFETLVSGDVVTLYYDPERTGSWTSIGTATYASDEGVTFKLLNKEFRANDIQFKVTAVGTSVPPVVNRLIVESKPEGLL